MESNIKPGNYSVDRGYHYILDNWEFIFFSLGRNTHSRNWVTCHCVTFIEVGCLCCDGLCLFNTFHDGMDFISGDRVFPYNSLCLNIVVAIYLMWFNEIRKPLDPTALSSPKFYGAWNSTISEVFLWAEVWSYLPFLFENTNISGKHNESFIFSYKSASSLSMTGWAFGQPKKHKNFKSKVEQKWSRPTLQVDFLLSLCTLGFFYNITWEKLPIPPNWSLCSEWIELPKVGSGPTRVFTNSFFFFFVVYKIQK